MIIYKMNEEKITGSAIRLFVVHGSRGLVEHDGSEAPDAVLDRTRKGWGRHSADGEELRNSPPHHAVGLLIMPSLSKPVKDTHITDVAAVSMPQALLPWNSLFPPLSGTCSALSK